MQLSLPLRGKVASRCSHLPDLCPPLLTPSAGLPSSELREQVCNWAAPWRVWRRSDCEAPRLLHLAVAVLQGRRGSGACEQGCDTHEPEPAPHGGPHCWIARPRLFTSWRWWPTSAQSRLKRPRRRARRTRRAHAPKGRLSASGSDPGDGVLPRQGPPVCLRLEAPGNGVLPGLGWRCHCARATNAHPALTEGAHAPRV